MTVELLQSAKKAMKLSLESPNGKVSTGQTRTQERKNCNRYVTISNYSQNIFPLMKLNINKTECISQYVIACKFMQFLVGTCYNPNLTSKKKF